MIYLTINIVIGYLNHDGDIFSVDPNSNDHDPLFKADTFSITVTVVVSEHWSLSLSSLLQRIDDRDRLSYPSLALLV